MGDRIVLNVGGKIFHTTRSTLLVDPNSMLAKMFDANSQISASVKDESGAWFIDRDPKYFRAVLNYLRDPTKVVVDPNVNIEGVLQEAKFFQIQSLIEQLQQFSQPDITRRDVCLYRSTIKFTCTRLAGLDLSDLNFDATSFESSNVSRTNFERCTFGSSNFTKAQATGANFSHCVAHATKFTDGQFSYCNFNNSNVTICNFNESNLTFSTFAEAVCNGALFQKSDLSHVTFTNANLQHVKFHSTKLFGADFTGANLDFCHMSYSDLRGAKSINWTYHKKMVVKNATITQEEYDAIPLTADEKGSLKLIIIEADQQEQQPPLVEMVQ